MSLLCLAVGVHLQGRVQARKTEWRLGLCCVSMSQGVVGTGLWGVLCAEQGALALTGGGCAPA